MRRFAMAAILAAGVLAAGLTGGPAAAAPTARAVGTGLWHCSPFGDVYTYACTTITSAPAGGVQVLDRASSSIYTLYNGNSIVLHYWHKDTSGRCGVGGNPYVWVVGWQNQGYHYAYIGDHYLNTGSVPNWNDFTDSWGHLGDNNHYSGTGSGTCDTFPTG